MRWRVGSRDESEARVRERVTPLSFRLRSQTLSFGRRFGGVCARRLRTLPLGTTFGGDLRDLVGRVANRFAFVEPTILEHRLGIGMAIGFVGRALPALARADLLAFPVGFCERGIAV